MILQLDDVSSVHSNGSPAIDRLKFNIEKNESVALLGANGAGKTSLFLTLTGILPLTGGSVYVDGLKLGDKTLDDVRKKIGFVFQNPDDQLFMSTVLEDVLFGVHNLALSNEICLQRACEALALTGTGDLKERSPLHLSGGEKRMAAIAGVLAMKPLILLLDEPTAFLDPKAVRSLVSVLNKLDQTKLIATHNLDFAREVCAKTLILKKGKLFAQGDISLLDDKSVIEEAFFAP